MLKIKRDTNQHDLKIADLYFVMSESFSPYYREKHFYPQPFNRQII